MCLHVPMGGGGQPPSADSSRASPWQSPPATILPLESGIAGLPQDDFFLNLLISIRSPGRGYYKISRKEVENPFSLISREHISAIATPSSPTFPEVFMITSLPTLRADQCLEATCQAFLLGKASAIKGPGSRVMALFIGGIPVVQRSNPSSPPLSNLPSPFFPPAF